MSKTRLDWLELISYTASPTDTDAAQRGICFVGTTPYYWTGTAWTAFSTGSSGSWETLYGADNSFDLAGGLGFTINGAMANSNDVLTVVADAASSGDAIQISQLGSGKDINGTSSTWYFTKLGALTVLSTTISGTAGSTIFTVTAGDLVVSDGSIAITDADNAATFTVTNNTATTASMFVIAGSGAFTGSTTTSFLTITPSGLTTGTAVYLPVAALTTGSALTIVANALTSGLVVSVTSSATAITGAGRLLNIVHSGATSTSGILAEVSSAANDETVIFKVTSSAALALGVALQVSGASITTGKAIEASNLNALTTGIGLHIASSATAITTTGRLLYVNHTGATGTSATLVEFLSAAADETVLFQVKNSALFTGDMAIFNAAATAAGIAVKVIATAATLTTGRYFSANDAALEVFGIGANGHIHTAQTTAPVMTTNATGISATAIVAGSSDVAGSFTTTGTPASGTVLTCTFHKTYTAAPKFVVISPINAAAGNPNTVPYISSITATTFVMTWPAGGTYAATPSYSYYVIA